MTTSQMQKLIDTKKAFPYLRFNPGREGSGVYYYSTVVVTKEVRTYLCQFGWDGKLQAVLGKGVDIA